MAMAPDLAQLSLFHITAIENLPSIIRSGNLLSDVALGGVAHRVIGYGHIKHRRMTEYRVDCCRGRFVGEFVPFYYCPRSPMLFTVDRGNVPGQLAGSQSEIVHLVTTVAAAVALGQEWAISDGNAGAAHTSFSTNIEDLRRLDWEAIQARLWKGRSHQKSAEFLVADRFPWTSIQGIGCYDEHAAARVSALLAGAGPNVAIMREWYY